MAYVYGTLTTQQLEAILPGIKEAKEWADVLNAYLPAYNVDTPIRVAAFLAQCGHESASFNTLKENLFYSAKGLRATWPSRFTEALAEQCAKQPEKIANIVYANRLGNGDTASGDGYKYRGRGVIQVTGKDNYRACSQFIFGHDGLLDDPDFLLNKPGAILSACWFWNANNLNRYADKGDFKDLTRRINGGYHGLADRQEKYKKALEVLQG